MIAGVRKAISPNIDLGLKYRFFNTTTLKYGDSNNGGELKGSWRSHSLLASLIYNFTPRRRLRRLRRRRRRRRLRRRRRARTVR